VIEARDLTKRYGCTLAVGALSFSLRPGVVTGFLGPNGSGKSTTMRLILGLDSPDAGYARIGGRRYRDLRWPLREVGALLRASGHADGLATLTRRERDVLVLMAEGRSNSGIAASLVVSPGVVEKHVAGIFAKLGLPPSEADNRRVLAVLRYLGS
jgi:ABC-type branched-subunit amino acid transport system ATPase component